MFSHDDNNEASLILNNIFSYNEVKSVKLAKRLAALSGHVPPGSVVADIGTDHALLPIYLLESGICRRVIATDVKPGPLQSAKQAVAACSWTDSVDLRLGDGLRPLTAGEAEVIVLAGMGGKTIIDILAAAPSILTGTQRLILQPMTGAEGLRMWLATNGWRLTKEELILEGSRIYQVIVAEHGRETETEPLLLSLGPRLLEEREQLLPMYLEQVIQRYRLILNGLCEGKSGEAREKAALLEDKLKRIEEMVKCR